MTDEESEIGSLQSKGPLIAIIKLQKIVDELKIIPHLDYQTDEDFCRMRVALEEKIEDYKRGGTLDYHANEGLT